MHPVITAEKFVKKISKDKSCHILDVRSNGEYMEVRLAVECIHQPIEKLDIAILRQSVKDQKKTVYVLCSVGALAGQVVDTLRMFGFEDVVVVEGGLQACIKCGADVVRCYGISIERQVRIVAGMLVLTGAALGAVFNPIFYVIVGFVGLGLIIAGTCNWCGMAILLTKAPWNKAACQTNKQT